MIFLSRPHSKLASMLLCGAYILSCNLAHGMDDAAERQRIAALKVYEEFKKKQTDDIVYNAAKAGSIQAKYEIGLKIINQEAKVTTFNGAIQSLPFEEGRNFLMQVAKYEPLFGGGDQEKINCEYKAKAQKYFQAFPNPLTQNIIVKNIHRFLDTNMFYGYVGMILISGTSVLVNMMYGHNYSPFLESFNRFYCCMFNSFKTIHSSTQYALTGHRDDLLESLSNVVSTIDYIYEYMKSRRLNMIENEILEHNKILESTQTVGADYEKEKKDHNDQIFLIDKEKKDIEGMLKAQQAAISSANTKMEELSTQKNRNSSCIKEVNKQLKKAESYWGVRWLGWKPKDYIEKDLLKKYEECKVANPVIDQKISIAKSKCAEAQKEILRFSNEHTTMDDKKLDTQILVQDLLHKKSEADHLQTINNKKIVEKREIQKKVLNSGKTIKSAALGIEVAELMKTSNPVTRSITMKETEYLGNISKNDAKETSRYTVAKNIGSVISISTKALDLMSSRKKINKFFLETKETIASTWVAITGFITDDFSLLFPQSSSNVD